MKTINASAFGFPTRLNVLGRSFVFVAWSAVLAVPAFATDYTLQSSGGWTKPATWGLESGYPNGRDANVLFDQNVTRTVTLDSADSFAISSIYAKKGTTTIAASADGAALNLNSSDIRTMLKVDAGATLYFNAPLVSSGRVDRYYTGTAHFNCTYTNTSSSTTYFCCGTNYLEGSTDFYLPNGGFHAGLDGSYGRKQTWPFYLKDRAKLTVKSLGFAGGTIVPDCQIIQDGPETAVSVSGALTLSQAIRDRNDDAYILKSGTLTVGGKVVVYGSYVSDKTYFPDYGKEHFIVEGGTATVYSISMAAGSAALRGGRLNFSRTDTTKATDLIGAGSGTVFRVAGGTLGWPMAFNPSDLTAIEWSGDSTVAPTGDFTWDFSKSAVVSNATVTYEGTGVLRFSQRKSTCGVGAGLAAGCKALVESGAAVVNPAGSYAPWKLSLADGSVFELASFTARVYVPVDLAVNGSATVKFSDSARHYLVAHKLTLNGVEQPKGRYTGSACDWISAGAGNAAVLVPYVWTGAGDGVNWEDGNNWEGGAVPPDGSDVCVDLSRATEITNTVDHTLGVIIALPNAGSRRVTVAGSGKITIGTSNGYDVTLVVRDDGELLFKAPVVRAAVGTLLNLGGGKVTFEKSALGLSNSSLAYVAVDGTYTFKDVTTLNNYGTVTTPHLAFFGTGSGTKGIVTVEGNTALAFKNIYLSPSGFVPIDEFRQKSGSVSAASLYIGRYNYTTHQPLYVLEGGTLSVTNLYLGENYSDKWTRYTGGSFEMSGGTLEVCRLKTCRNQNYVTAYGGTILFNDLTGLTQSSVSSTDTNVDHPVQNDYGYYLGGVTLKGKNTTAVIPSGTKVYLTGRNGGLKVDTSVKYCYFQDNVEIAGSGGITSVGNTAKAEFWIRSKCLFTGDVTVSSGALVFDNNGGHFTLDGPRALRVKAGLMKFTSSVTNGQIATTPEIIELASNSSLVMESSSLSLTVKRLVIGGVTQPEGTYTFSNGTVIVKDAPTSWLDGTAGDLTFVDPGSSVTLTDDTTLDSLACRASGTVAVNPTASEKLVFSDGATIDVASGSTIEINADVVLGGKVTMTGYGTVKFNGAVTCPDTVEKGASGSDAYWFTVEHGEADFAGAVTGVRIASCSNGGDVPLIVLKPTCTVSDHALVLTAYTEDTTMKNCRGETHQEAGATVDYTTVPITFADSAAQVPLSRPNGGFGRYVMEGGTFTFGTRNMSFVKTASDQGSFEFVQNGGTLKARQMFFARTTSGVSFDYVLNAGTLEASQSIQGYDRSMGRLTLNGGKLVLGGNQQVIRDRYVNVRFGDGAQLVLATETATDEAVLDVDLVGNGVTVDFQGPGTIGLRGYGLDTLTVTGGGVLLDEAAAASLSPSVAIALGKDGFLNLDYGGTVPVGSVTANGEEGPANRNYGARGYVRFRSYFRGEGLLNSATGGLPPGLLLLIR